MSDGRDRELSEMERAASDLQESLKRCQQLVSSLRGSLAANSNEPMGPDKPHPSEFRREM